MKTIMTRITLSFAAATRALFVPHSALAQNDAAHTAQIHGHVQNALGLSVTGTVKLSSDTQQTDDKLRKYLTDFKVDENGNFKGSIVSPPAGLVAFYFNDKNQMVDYLANVNLKVGQDNTVNIDMTRPEYIAKMSPEEKAQMEEIKKHNAGAMAANAKIANLNVMLKTARDEMKTNPDDAVKQMLTATQAKPDEPVLWVTLGQAEQAQADALLATNKKLDEDVKAKYNTASDSYKKALDLDTAKKAPNAQEIAVAYNQLGQIQGKLGNATEAVAAYDNAAKAVPASAGMYYNNEAATLYNAQKMDEAAAAADKAIAAEPSRADPYYIKGQALIQKASVDPKTQKITAPPGCVEAYQKYLELAPTGPHAEEIKGILSGIGATVTSTYKAPAKKK